MLQDPKELEAAARGSRMAPEEQRQAELAQNGLIVSPLVSATMDAKTKLEMLKYGYLSESLEKKIQAELQKEQIAAAATTTSAGIHAGATVQAAKIHSAAFSERTGIMKDTLKKLNDSKMLMYEGKVNESNVQRSKMFGDMIKSLRTAASKSGVSSDEATQLNKEADMYEKQLKAVDDQTVSPLDLQMQIMLQTLGVTAPE